MDVNPSYKIAGINILQNTLYNYILRRSSEIFTLLREIKDSGVRHCWVTITFFLTFFKKISRKGAKLAEGSERFENTRVICYSRDIIVPDEDYIGFIPEIQRTGIES